MAVSTKGGKQAVVDENAAVGNADAAEAKNAEANAWMAKDNAAAVVVPGSKSTRPGLRSVRRRRSSFSAADVVA
jgi:cell division cycle 14